MWTVNGFLRLLLLLILSALWTDAVSVAITTRMKKISRGGEKEPNVGNSEFPQLPRTLNSVPFNTKVDLTTNKHFLNSMLNRHGNYDMRETILLGTGRDLQHVSPVLWSRLGLQSATSSTGRLRTVCPGKWSMRAYS